jgi:hypothetical protein
MKSPTVASGSRAANQEVFARRCEATIQRIGAVIEERGNARLRSLLPGWQARLKDILAKSREKPEVAISLVGGTGAGKSTLLNALVGARVLPVSNMRACTAAVCEVSYADGPYQARIEFVSRKSWEKQIQLLLSDLRDTQSPPEVDDMPDPREQMSRAVRDTLWTVYRQSDDSKAFDPFDLVEPEEIRQALDAGSTQFRCDDLDDFRKQIRLYLESKHRFWPIVKSVGVRGPFESLRDGAKIIDLPGVNDINEAREAVTRSHLKTCRFVWLVFNSKRGLTKDTFGLMISDDFARQIVMDGRTDALTFVGTAADDAKTQEIIEELDLDEETDKLGAIVARNSAIRQDLGKQIDELAHRLSQLAGDQHDSAIRITKQLKSSKVFTVSASEYLRLCGLSKADPAGFSDPEQTEIPALIDHLRQVCKSNGVRAHEQALQRQLNLTFEEMRRELAVGRNALKERAHLTEKNRKEVQAAVEVAWSFLDRELDHVREHLKVSLENAHSLLAERIRRAVERARSELDQRVGAWHGMNHLTLRAICRRGGVFTSSNGQRFDLPADLSKPILDGIAFAWSEFFGEQLQQVLSQAKTKLVNVADGFRRHLKKALSASPVVSTDLFNSIDAGFETNENVLRELLAQIQADMEARILQDQRTLYDRVPDQVRANMRQAFMEASEEKGTGMKQRILGVLARQSKKVAQVMFDDARDSLLGGVRNLNDWLKKEFEEMVSTVKRSGELAGTNLLAFDERLTTESIALENQLLEQVSETLAECESID